MPRHALSRLARRLTIAVGLPAMLAGAVFTGPSASAADTTTFNVGQLNILNSLSNADFYDDLDLVTSRAGLVGLNEVDARRDELKAWLADHPGWQMYMPDGAAANNAMLAKTRFVVLDKGSVFATDTNGPGEVPPARYVNWVKYRDSQSGRVIFHLHTHVNSGIQENGGPATGSGGGILPRVQDAEDHLRLVKQMATEKKDHGQVVVTGDLNVDFVSDKQVQYSGFPYVVLDEREDPAKLPGLRSNYALHGVKGEGTHGSRHIDYVYLWKRQDVADRVLRMTDYSVVTGTRSDHNAVVASFTVDIE